MGISSCISFIHWKIIHPKIPSLQQTISWQHQLPRREREATFGVCVCAYVCRRARPVGNKGGCCCCYSWRIASDSRLVSLCLFHTPTPISPSLQGSGEYPPLNDSGQRTPDLLKRAFERERVSLFCLSSFVRPYRHTP